MRLFFEEKDLLKTSLSLSRDRFHYLSRVRRIQPGDAISIIINRSCYRITVTKLDDQYLHFDALTPLPVLPPRCNISLIQCLPKQAKLDTIINAATQLGITHIYPVESQRSIVKWSAEKQTRQQDRWQSICRQASEQAKHFHCPTVHPIQSLTNFCQTSPLPIESIRLVPWESENKCTLKSVLSLIPHDSQPQIAVLIGPEGGLAIDEITQLHDSGFTSVSLGNAIYRTEIAGIVTLSQLHYHFS